MSTPIDINQLKQQRTSMLDATDHLTFIPDLTDTQRTALYAFRQALRDITANVENGTYTTVEELAPHWPVMPQDLLGL